MKINHTAETSEGDIVFQGVLEGKELDFVIEVGINTLLQKGFLPLISGVTYNKASFMDAPDQDQ